jgi:energy-coupling factor transporter transmembrane protein EcfT
VTKEDKQLLVSWIFAGGWVLLLLIGLVVAWRVARQPHATYRSFVPFIGLVTAFLLAGTIAFGSSYYPH